MGQLRSKTAIPTAAFVEHPASGPFERVHLDRAMLHVGMLGEVYALRVATGPELRAVVEGRWRAASNFADSFRPSPRDAEYEHIYWTLPHWLQRYSLVSLTTFRKDDVYSDCWVDSLRGPDDGPRSETFGAKIDGVRALRRLPSEEWERLFLNYDDGQRAIAQELKKRAGEG